MKMGDAVEIWTVVFMKDYWYDFDENFLAKKQDKPNNLIAMSGMDSQGLMAIDFVWIRI